MDINMDREKNIQRLIKEVERYGKLVVAYDFDGTVHNYNEKTDLNDYKEVIKLIREIREYINTELVVYTCSEPSRYDYIKAFLNENNIPFNYINDNSPELKEQLPKGGKMYYNILLDDRAGLKEAYEILKGVLLHCKRGDEFEPMKEIEDIIQWIRSFKIKGAVIGISGGKDSTVVGKLLVEALGKDKVFGVLMPNGVQKDICSSQQVVRDLGIAHMEVNIGETYHTLTKEIKMISNESAINIAPRLRMTTLYSVAQTLGYRVAGTGNMSEAYVGYTTKWGDNACDFNPIGNYTKEEVVAIGLALGLDRELVCKTPSDGLSGQTDEEKLGFTYEEVEDVINGVIRHNKIAEMHEYSRHKFEPIPTYDRI